MSQFINNSDYRSGYSSEIDFEDAFLLKGEGSTCDIYTTRWQSRTVFVKRLKETYRNKPIFLDALEKEYEVGANLKHQSLPTYLHFHRDYIVMDFIDGKTLTQLIKTHDRWLSKEENVVRLLRELVDVVGYLHRHNIVHCDIKPDNIMITNNTRNLFLIDFDKCYTDSLSDTPGHPGRYGLPVEACGQTTLDFRGVANVLRRIKEAFPKLKLPYYAKFIKECCGSEPEAERLLEILKGKSGFNPGLLIPVVFIGTAILAGLIFLIFYHGEESERSVVAKEIYEKTPSEETIISSEEPVEKVSVKTEKSQEKGEITQESILSEAQKKAQILDRRISPYFNQLTQEVENLGRMINDTTVSSAALYAKLSSLSDKEDEYFSEVNEIINELFPEVGTEREKWRIISQSSVITTYNRLSKPVLYEAGRKVASGGLPDKLN